MTGLLRHSFTCVLLSVFFNPVSAQDFTGQVYLLAQDFDEKTCTVSAECDCCGTNLAFISDKKFVMINYCLFEDSYYSGTYALTSGRLELTFKQWVVNHIMDENSDKETIKKTEVQMHPLEFTISTCADTRLKLDQVKNELIHGTRINSFRERAILEKIKKSPEVKLLNKWEEPIREW